MIRAFVGAGGKTTLIHEQADYPGSQAYGLEKAEEYRKRIVNLPCSTNLTREDCQRVIDLLLSL